MQTSKQIRFGSYYINYTYLFFKYITISFGIQENLLFLTPANMGTSVVPNTPISPLKHVHDDLQSGK